ncbi:MAG TPA: Gfo/Idh/MocA family oxidoreductase [Terriglobales bacterium]
MGFLQIGLGSMGKRRIRCLRALGQSRIWAYDPRVDRRREAHDLYGVEPVASIEEGLAMDIDAVLISTPPDLHYASVRDALAAGKHMFCEANIVTEGAAEFTAMARARHLVAAPSATMRFHPLYQHLRRLVVEDKALGRPLALNFHLGNYILDWHPWEGQQGLDFYGGRRATGAAREMVPFEFEWMEWVFGPVAAVQCSHRRQLDLPTDIEDVYAIVAEFRSGLIATILIDVIARYPIRDGRLLSQQGSVYWDFDSNRLRHFHADTGLWREYKASPRGFNMEEMYIAEIDAFLQACRGQTPWSHSYQDDERLSRVLLACERSSQSGQRVELQEEQT